MSIINRWFGKRDAAPLTNQPAVLFSVDPVTKTASQRVERGGHCACLQTRTKKGGPGVPNLHVEPQDLTTPGWGRIVELLKSSGKADTSVFEPSVQMPAAEWAGVITLPSEIGELKMLKGLRLYGSHLRRLPPELGRLSALESLDIYTSYSLHWLPYEVIRCISLRETRKSTRALYGNRKTRLPFPRLSRVIETLLPDTCSVCDQPFGTASPQLFWTTLRVGTDDAPLLVHSCLEKCTTLVPDAPAGYHRRPHKGGGGVGMPYPEVEYLKPK